MARAVISAIGRDRPGIVNELSQAVLENGLNIEDSRMTVLGGEFAVLMSVSGAETSLDMLKIEIRELADNTGLAHLFRKTSEAPVSGRNRLEVRVSAMDHPGIVSGVAGFFSKRGINILELHTKTSPAAHTGTPVFSLELKIDVPTSTRTDSLQSDFDAYCGDNDLDGELNPAS